MLCVLSVLPQQSGVSNLIYCLSGAASKVRLITYCFSIRFNFVYDVGCNYFRCMLSRFEPRDMWPLLSG